ncbi:5-methyltetrahydropteroyltriglutamate--homocysteine S-methyltransferase [Pelagibacterium sediminicola]|uniref:5-methyltetrahydropteroyltriglutamate-- homocysteine S-methyltransferase n=1 Tax=Pelagibacterium sediminicola TaxID=2248761 RepID=UPI000E3122A9|nr:5-methyltetrahydropteroyltriglutamate--homocysteine S-methyltransferase [Pelagibacterium sediminicola]
MSVKPPPYRADHVGSLLRNDAVKTARHEFYDEKSIGRDALTAVEDDAIREAIKLQEDVGLPVVTDGELRRSFWHYDFMEDLEGFKFVERDVATGHNFKGANTRPIFPTITGPVDFPADHPMLEHFKFVAANTSVMPKISIPGPSCCHFRVAKADIGHKPYADDLELLFADLAKAYKKAVNAFYEAGCRYLQMDDIFFAYLCDPKIRAEKQAEGLDPDWLIDQYAKMMHDAIDGRPDDMMIGMHMCRGNFKSTWIAEGAYDPAADAVFNKTGVDIYFMEYDTDRAGGLEPLRLLPKGNKRVLPGFITTKSGELETVDDLRRKFDEVAKYADLDQFGIAPQCGFSSTEEGNDITIDDQKRKLELVVKTAEAIWGEV